MSPALGPAHALTLVGASAGSGKTHRLTEVVVDAVAPGQTDAIDPGALAAVTYTRRAASELAARIRRELVKAGAHERALRLPLAYLGTVHAVCLRLVQEFAIDAGLSPQVDVLPGDEARWLREALEWGLDPEFRNRVQTLADGLELRWNQRLRRTDWLTPVQDLMALARGNRIAPASLPAMAERSVASLLALMGPPERDGDALERELLAALQKVDRALGEIHDDIGKTETARQTVKDKLRDAAAGRLLWSDWVRLQQLAPAKAVAAVVAPLIEVASRVERHPRLQAEVRDLIRGIYEAARQGLEAYDGWKKHRRVVDFVDMIDRALTLVDRPDVQEELRSRLKLLVVDEFQDTSPVQLALFVRLHPIAGHSTWVGDRKQCIFEFAGADPALMEAVTTWAARSGGETPRLDQNWRSRPELVEACSTLFAAAFARHGYRPEEIAVEAVRTTPTALSGLPPLGLWWLETTKQEEDAAALAEGVRRLLEAPSATPVVDRSTGEVRDVRAGDVAVLVATNKEAAAVASELARRGVHATVARTGLLSTPEGAIVQAALSTLVDPCDEYSRAVLEALTGFGGQGAEAWLDARIAAVSQRKQAQKNGEPAPASVPSEPVARIEALRPHVETLAPSEALDAVLAATDLAALCARWPDPEQRLANLDALRALTASYEEHCAHQRAAATIAGLLRFFEEAAEEQLVRDEEIASDDQHVGAGEHAVTIVTYHRAKGLEWPVVILSSLDRGERRDAFEVCPETDRAAFDAADPLGGRWIRYWPWPFGPPKKARLKETAAASTEGRSVALREERERVRLLYVGFTRARDHLILAARKAKKGPAVEWLDELCDGERRPLLGLPAAPEGKESAVVEVRGPDGRITKVPARHWLLGTGADTRARLTSVDSHVWFARPDGPPVERPTYWISPSQADSDWPDLAVPEVAEGTSIGERLPLGDAKGVGWDVVGDAVHAFLAADVAGLGAPDRLELARRLLAASNLLALLAPEALVRAGDQLRSWVESRWPGATWHREVPVTAAVGTPHGTRRVQGTIDLLLETPEGVVIIDHKSFPGGANQWTAKAAEFAPQLAAYAHVLTAAGRSVVGMYAHFTIGAGVVRLR
jgi:ATP-dependent exoDNAse (exonuclease V) beta subunit